MWGRKEVAIPISAVSGADDGIRLNLTKDGVRDLPPVDIDHLTDVGPPLTDRYQPAPSLVPCAGRGDAVRNGSDAGHVHPASAVAGWAGEMKLAPRRLSVPATPGARCSGLRDRLEALSRTTAACQPRVRLCTRAAATGTSDQRLHHVEHAFPEADRALGTWGRHTKGSFPRPWQNAQRTVVRFSS